MKPTEIQHLLHGDSFDPYLAAAEKGELRGWTDPSAIFAQVGQSFRPRNYLEVGSWLGLSAIRAARTMPELETIACVDTWLGAAEHWTDTGRPDHDMFRDEAGQPRLYETFLRNILDADLAHQVVPVRLPSTIAAEVMEHHRIGWDVIYIDGSHSYRDVLNDLYAWWPRCQRVMIGDDWSDPRFGVADAVVRFLAARETARPADLRVSGNFWMIIRG